MFKDATSAEADFPYGSPSALESEVNRAAYAHWCRLRGDRAMPARADLDPADIVPLLPHLLLLDVQWEPMDFRYRLIGTLVAELSAEHSGRWMRDLPHQAPPSHIFAACETVARGAEPIITNVPYEGKLRDIRRLEDVMMPLSNDGLRVNMLFICADFL